jgi:hypothetical protein
MSHITPAIDQTWDTLVILILGDGWQISVFVNEIDDLLEAFCYVFECRRCIPCNPCCGPGRIRRIRMFLGLLDPDPLVRGMDPDPSIIMQK